jgi:hypothetical protein
MAHKKQFDSPPGRVALFVTCMIDMIYPEVGWRPSSCWNGRASR